MEHFDIAIIGTGSGNSILDDRYADKRVAICEQGTFGGTCLNVGCIPTKMFVYAAEVAQTIRDAARFGVDATLDGVRWSDIVSRVFGRIDPIAMGGENYRRSSPNVTVFDTHTRFGRPQPDGRYTLRTEGGDEFTADQVVIAAGSRATVPDAIRDCGVDYYTSDTIMRIGELPKHLVIVGGGFVAAEFAHTFSALGTRVIAGHPRRNDCCGTATTPSASGSPTSRRRSGRSTTTATWSARARTATASRLTLDNGATVQGDTVLVATGRIPNGDLLDAELAGVEVRDGSVVVDEYQRTTARGIFALGDVSSDYQLKHVANHESRAVRENLLLDWDDTDSLKQSDHRYVPSAVFTDPQIAMVGLTENQARAKGYNVIVEGAGLRRRRLRLGDGGHHRHRQDHRRRRLGIDPRRAHHGPPGLVVDPADHPGDELRPGRPGHGAGPVLDPSGPAGGHRERVARAVRRAAVAARPPPLSLTRPQGPSASRSVRSAKPQGR